MTIRENVQLYAKTLFIMSVYFIFLASLFIVV